MLGLPNKHVGSHTALVKTPLGTDLNLKIAQTGWSGEQEYLGPRNRPKLSLGYLRNWNSKLSWSDGLDKSSPRNQPSLNYQFGRYLSADLGWSGGPLFLRPRNRSGWPP